MRKADPTTGLSDAGMSRLLPLPEAGRSASRAASSSGRRRLGPAPRQPGLLPEPATEAEPPGHLGHRARMRQRLLTAGPEAVLDHELLEMVLFLALPRR